MRTLTQLISRLRTGAVHAGEFDAIADILQQQSMALEAIAARINGEYDNPSLVAFGPLSISVTKDISGFIRHHTAIEPTAAQVGVYKTRADLMSHPDFKDLETDTNGNPCVWRNHYYVRGMDNSVSAWTSNWSCQCDEDGYSPHESDWLPSGGDESYLLWEGLPEAGA
jgi:hypothetical protein